MAGVTRHEHLSPEEFHEVVEEALEDLPEEFANLLENIAVFVEEEPAEDDLESVHHPDGELLGIFRGLPMTARSYAALPLLPNQVVIFRGPILRVTRTRAEARQQVRQTVMHELGHYFGLSDEAMVY
jgi:predicted Zn-dependent protease with MMP-like domain